MPPQPESAPGCRAAAIPVPETLAAQALGEAGPVSGGLTRVINLSTNYEQQPGGFYRQARVCTRADNVGSVA